jgi:hypothetical protein
LKIEFHGIFIQVTQFVLQQAALPEYYSLQKKKKKKKNSPVVKREHQG